jgi:hypothetical protein
MTGLGVRVPEILLNKGGFVVVKNDSWFSRRRYACKAAMPEGES